MLSAAPRAEPVGGSTALVPAPSELQAVRSVIEASRGQGRANKKASRKQEADLLEQQRADLEKFAKDAYSGVQEQVSVPLPEAHCAACPAAFPTFQWLHPGATMAQAVAWVSCAACS